jgi:hypothetical protein
VRVLLCSGEMVGHLLADVGAGALLDGILLPELFGLVMVTRVTAGVNLCICGVTIGCEFDYWITTLVIEGVGA